MPLPKLRLEFSERNLRLVQSRGLVQWLWGFNRDEAHRNFFWIGSLCELISKSISVLGSFQSHPNNNNTRQHISRIKRHSTTSVCQSTRLSLTDADSAHAWQVLRMPLFQLPQLVTQLVNARVALHRLEELLAADQQPSIPALPAAAPGESSI